jgi:hypothetical protein
MSQPPVLDYATPPGKNLLGKAANLLLRVLGTACALAAVFISLPIAVSLGSIANWLLLLLVLATSLIFLLADVRPDRAGNRGVVLALLATLVSIGVDISCLGQTFFWIPQEAPDGLVRLANFVIFIPIAFILFALAVLLILILRQAKTR